MKGAIRFFAGLVITAAAVGGIETSVTDFELVSATLIAFGGLAVMGSGTKALVGKLA